MSFREKSAWICLVTTVLVFVPYFAFVFVSFSPRGNSLRSSIGAFVAAICWQILLNVGAHIAIGIRAGREPKDERDVAIEAKAYRNAYLVLVGLAWTVPFVSMPIAGALGQGGLTFVVLTIQLLLLSFIVAEAARYLSQIIFYRRGI